MLEFFDIEAYLEDRGVHYNTSGKNVSSGWIGMTCLWCDDQSNHLGINLSTKKFKCWICGHKGVATRIVEQIDKVHSGKAEEIIKEFQQYSRFKAKPKEKIQWSQALPEESTVTLPEIHKDYLLSRNFNPIDIQKMYDIRACYNLGDYKFRIIIPVIMNHKIVGFTSRDITDKSSLRYKACENDRAVIPQDEWVYNLDSLIHTALILEGPFDVWRMGPGAICLFGIDYSLKQVRAIVSKGVYRVFILFDEERTAQKRANELGETLASIVSHVQILSGLEVKDPAKLSPKEAHDLKREIFDFK